MKKDKPPQRLSLSEQDTIKRKKQQQEYLESIPDWIEDNRVTLDSFITDIEIFLGKVRRREKTEKIAFFSIISFSTLIIIAAIFEISTTGTVSPEIGGLLGRLILLLPIITISVITLLGRNDSKQQAEFQQIYRLLEENDFELKRIYEKKMQSYEQYVLLIYAIIVRSFNNLPDLSLHSLQDEEQVPLKALDEFLEDQAEDATDAPHTFSSLLE